MIYNKTITMKRGIEMAFFIIFIASIVLGLCLAEGKSKKGFLGLIIAILYFPLGVIFELSKKYK